MCTHVCICTHNYVCTHIHVCAHTKYTCTRICACVLSGLCQDSLTELHALAFPSWSTRDNLVCVYQMCGLPWWLSGKESACQCRRCCIPWVGKIPLQKEMATHCSTLALEIPWTEEPGELQSTGSQRVGHDWATNPPPPYQTWSSRFPTCGRVVTTNTEYAQYAKLCAGPYTHCVLLSNYCHHFIGQENEGREMTHPGLDVSRRWKGFQTHIIAYAAIQ